MLSEFIALGLQGFNFGFNICFDIFISLICPCFGLVKLGTELLQLGFYFPRLGQGIGRTTIFPFSR
ncbi:MAG: hypothetical protein D6676_00635 [Cyanobacteria bacterium J003]|nr:MAG: hypothetical protein D6676_00635 [Cyanobacteria bacterium J003]